MPSHVKEARVREIKKQDAIEQLEFDLTNLENKISDHIQAKAAKREHQKQRTKFHMDRYEKRSLILNHLFADQSPSVHLAKRQLDLLLRLLKIERQRSFRHYAKKLCY